MKTNTKTVSKAVTHEGIRVSPGTPLAELKRTVVNCMLFENTFYESGNKIADRIKELITSNKIAPAYTSDLAFDTRTRLGLRHVSLWMAACLAKQVSGSNYGDRDVVSKTIAAVICRADELSEFLSLYWKVNGKKCPLSAQVKKGLAQAFTKFDEYQIGKWNKPDAEIKLRDVLFLCHAKPKDDAQAALFRALVDNTVATPDTWETELSAGKDKAGTFTRLLGEKRLGAMALLRNLRGMQEAGVDRQLILRSLETANPRGILPGQFLAANRYAPSFGPAVEQMMFRSLGEMPKLRGTTHIVVDISPSMMWALGGEKSKISRRDGAMALAIQAREQCEDVRIYSFSRNLKEVPAHRGFGLCDTIWNSQPSDGTLLKLALTQLKQTCPVRDRVIVITDEESQDGILPAWTERAYLMNVAPYKYGLDLHNGWQRISGFSERLAAWILEIEGTND